MVMSVCKRGKASTTNKAFQEALEQLFYLKVFFHPVEFWWAQKAKYLTEGTVKRPKKYYVLLKSRY